MKATNEIRQEIAPLFSPIIGQFRLKTYFSYYAVFKNDLMIALYQNNSIYLRIATKYSELIFNHPDTNPLCDDKIGLQSNKFYNLPADILANNSLFTDLVISIVDELNQLKQECHKKRATQIRNLPNMNIKLERMLKKIGILSIQDFIEEGYIKVFIKLVIQGIDVTEELLFKLNGALNHQYIYTFTEQQKRELMQEANQALYEAGLRKRFAY
ncbi:DNA transformation protein [Mannheimia granulomatis]|uniref:DNA transformation protein n=1 Tax=Mannheimia granulomatis TaxID=85402 RepID=A0A6G8JKM3_9PAST|nr:TfoX/Sxy family DNA transformation protein [Mannheimia granulomatis]QIM67533.1 DNA transformation protein [Mannheimia granulomatis]